MRRDPLTFLTALLPAATLSLGATVGAHGHANGAVEGRHFPVAVSAAILALLIAPLAIDRLAPEADLTLVGVTGMLQAIGVAALVAVARAATVDGPFYASVASRQALFVAAGPLALLAGVVTARHIEQIRRFPYTLLALALALTLSTMVIGQTVNGARLWLRLGTFTFQPSEVARLALVGFVSVYLYDKRHLALAPWTVSRLKLPPAPYFLPLVAAIVAAIAVLVVQNDLGMAALIAIGAFASFVTVVRSRVLSSMGLLILGAAAASSYAIVPRVGNRVAAWLAPWRDPTGTGFQFIQADYALAAAGLTGRPTTAGAIRVPEIHTDFVIAAVGGQFGWLVAAGVIALLGVLVCRCALATLRAETTLQALLALAFATLIATQSILILGGTLRVLPLTGLTLPLVSYGGTSMLSTLFAIGVTVGIGAGGADKRLSRQLNAVESARA